ncbi:MAG: hypothetical protein LBQ94_09585 [Treponema sp.]|nr:hypothetical protein [Treponema sp.]
MRKISGVVFVFCLVLILAGCKSGPASAAEGGMPDWVLKARRDAPEGVIVGIGTAKMPTTNQSMNTSETRARAQIVRAMRSMVSNMIEDYTVSSEVDPSAVVAFQQEITVALGRADLSGAVIEVQNSDRDGAWWTVVYFNKAAATREINTAQSLSRLAPAYGAAMLAEDRMAEQFEKAAQEDWVGFTD